VAEESFHSELSIMLSVICVGFEEFDVIMLVA
jgi:hypothetical protein